MLVILLQALTDLPDLLWKFSLEEEGHTLRSKQT